MERLAVFLVAFLLFSCVNGDTYMHNPRGSNNRLNENNQNRNNDNRLFDSQNNNRGGYNVGDGPNARNNGQGDQEGVMEYYESSQLVVEWTNQHGANNPKMNSNLVLQYTCDNTFGANPYDTTTDAGIRDGSSTDRIDTNNPGNTARGKHEPLAVYTDCNTRERNKGLFIADQDLDGDTAIYTRQNTNGERYGFECTEERDYYPYWHPTVWIDIANFVDTELMETMCGAATTEPGTAPTSGYYYENSENVIGKNYCSDTQYNNEADCIDNGATWNLSPSHATTFPQAVTGGPECLEYQWSRDNHLGLSMNGESLQYKWTIPKPLNVGNQQAYCVLRLRYNISTGDYDGWTTDYTFNEDDDTDVKESPIQDNPQVNIGDMDHVASVQLALNTDQYGRTFQTRSHGFRILERPASVPQSATIYNLNVRGRRGNIVQTYPAIEYDFTPNNQTINVGDLVHIQWTGSVSTPDGAGQGAANTDKSNIVCIQDTAKTMPAAASNSACNLFASTDVRLCMMSGGEYCPTSVATNGIQGQGQDPGNTGRAFNADLNTVPAYFNGGLQTIGGDTPGTYGFLSTRNNNFSNRAHKGRIHVV